MKLSLSLLTLAVVVSSFSGCATSVNRREMYWPAEASGPYAKRYEAARANEGIYGISQNETYPAADNEGIFGVSHDDEVYIPRSRDVGGIFGVSGGGRIKFD